MKSFQSCERVWYLTKKPEDSPLFFFFSIRCRYFSGTPFRKSCSKISRGVQACRRRTFGNNFPHENRVSHPRFQNHAHSFTAYPSTSWSQQATKGPTSVVLSLPCRGKPWFVSWAALTLKSLSEGGGGGGIISQLQECRRVLRWSCENVILALNLQGSWNLCSSWRSCRLPLTTPAPTEWRTLSSSVLLWHSLAKLVTSSRPEHKRAFIIRRRNLKYGSFSPLTLSECADSVRAAKCRWPSVLLSSSAAQIVNVQLTVNVQLLVKQVVFFFQ